MAWLAALEPLPDAWPAHAQQWQMYCLFHYGMQPLVLWLEHALNDAMPAPVASTVPPAPADLPSANRADGPRIRAQLRRTVYALLVGRIALANTPWHRAWHAAVDVLASTVVAMERRVAEASSGLMPWTWPMVDVPLRAGLVRATLVDTIAPLSGVPCDADLWRAGRPDLMLVPRLHAVLLAYARTTFDALAPAARAPYDTWDDYVRAVLPGVAAGPSGTIPSAAAPV
jgi:hypothetical protein